MKDFYGWILPDGTAFACADAQHEDTADKLLQLVCGVADPDEGLTCEESFIHRGAVCVGDNWDGTLYYLRANAVRDLAKAEAWIFAVEAQAISVDILDGHSREEAGCFSLDLRELRESGLSLVEFASRELRSERAMTRSDRLLGIGGTR